MGRHMMDFSNLNNLTPEQKIVIANGQALFEETNDMIKSRKYLLDITSLWQLKADCREIQMLIKMILNGKKIDKNIALLQNATVRLRTNLNGIVSFYERG